MLLLATRGLHKQYDVLMWWLVRVVLAVKSGVACQRQHWPSHKRQCRALADAELGVIFQRCTYYRVHKI
jgi:hypothetical protein